MRLNLLLELGDGAAVEQKRTWIETDEQLPFALQIGELGGRYAVVIVNPEEQREPDAD